MPRHDDLEFLELARAEAEDEHLHDTVAADRLVLSATATLIVAALAATGAHHAARALAGSMH